MSLKIEISPFLVLRVSYITEDTVYFFVPFMIRPGFWSIKIEIIWFFDQNFGIFCKFPRSMDVDHLGLVSLFGTAYN